MPGPPSRSEAWLRDHRDEGSWYRLTKPKKGRQGLEASPAGGRRREESPAADLPNVGSDLAFPWGSRNLQHQAITHGTAWAGPAPA